MPAKQQLKLNFVDELKSTTGSRSNKNNSTKTKQNRNENIDMNDYVKSSTSNPTTEDWLSSTMKKVVKANSIDDIKMVCCDLIAKVAEISTKLTVEAVKKEGLENANRILRDDFTKFSVHYDEEVQNVKDQVVAVSTTSATNESINQVADKIEDLEGRSRRNNLRFSGIQEGAEYGFDEGYNMELFIESTISECIGISLRPGSVQRAHRIGPRKPDSPRQSIAYFLCYQDKELVKSSNKKQSALLK
jgi:hypothetical protein